MRPLHLDLKGIIPSEKKFLKWLNWFRTRGFDALVLEYDCRVPWKVWAGAGSPLLTKSAVKRLVGHAEKLGFEVIPLIQIHGHLEWILKNPEYSFLRENGNLNELCPCHAESFPKMRRWIDEVAGLHPHAEKIHLGGDETWHLGTCPRCRKAIQNDPARRGRMGLYLDHVSALCRYAWEEKRLRPMLWDDMFCGGSFLPSPGVFPEATIFVHWKYSGKVTDRLDRIRGTGFEVWGASAIRCAWKHHHWKALNPIGERLANIADWEKTGLSVLHTTWGRPNNLWNLYGPWEALIPEFTAAGSPEKWSVHPWRSFVRELDNALLHADREALKELADNALSLPCGDAMEEEAKKWFHLGIRYELLHLESLELFQTKRCLAVLNRYACRDRRRAAEYRDLSRECQRKTALWERDLLGFWRRNELSDEAEYLDTRLAGICHGKIRTPEER